MDIFGDVQVGLVERQRLDDFRVLEPDAETLKPVMSPSTRLLLPPKLIQTAKEGRAQSHHGAGPAHQYPDPPHTGRGGSRGRRHRPAVMGEAHRVHEGKLLRSGRREVGLAEGGGGGSRGFAPGKRAVGPALNERAAARGPRALG